VKKWEWWSEMVITWGSTGSISIISNNSIIRKWLWWVRQKEMELFGIKWIHWGVRGTQISVGVSIMGQNVKTIYESVLLQKGARHWWLFKWEFVRNCWFVVFLFFSTIFWTFFLHTTTWYKVFYFSILFYSGFPPCCSTQFCHYFPPTELAEWVVPWVECGFWNFSSVSMRIAVSR